MKLYMAIDTEDFSKFIMFEKDNKEYFGIEAIEEMKKTFRRLPLAIINTQKLIQNYDLSNFMNLIRATIKIKKTLKRWLERHNFQDIDINTTEGNIFILATKEEVKIKC